MIRIALGAALAALLPLAAAQAQLDIAGHYVGEMYSNSALQPTDTTFFFKGDSYAGTYIIHDPVDGDVHGKIIDMIQNTNGNWTFTWKDMYGEGPATVSFTPSGDSFTGKWYIESRPIGVWNGIRQD
jgi:hypothetical protein